MKRFFMAVVACSLLLALLFGASGKVHASPDRTAVWDSTSDWKGGTYENARVYNGSVDIGLYPPEPHFDGSSWYFYTYEITEVDALYADYKSGRAYFYAEDHSLFSSETGSAYAYARNTFYLDSAGVSTETLEFFWKGYSDDFNQGDGTTTLTIQLQRPGETGWHNLWSKTFDTPSTGAEGTETVNVSASLLDTSGYYKMGIFVEWYLDVTGAFDAEKFEWYVGDISFGFNRAEHTTQWRSMGAMSTWKTLEASASIGTGERITARVEVSDGGIHVDDYKEISLKNGTNTYPITDLEDARYVRVRTRLYGYYESFTPELNKYIVTADPIPSLSSGSVTPDIDEIGSTFTYTVTYSDPDGDAPSYVNVYIDGVEYNMAKISGTYTGGATYRFTTSTLDLGSYSYYFWASDGTSSVRLPTSVTYEGPTVVPPNQPPSLSSGSVSPSSGTTSTTFAYEVTYSDADEDAPSYMRVYIDGSPYSMSKVSGTYISGATYQYTTSSLSTGSHSYYFETSDGIDIDRLPPSGSNSGPTVSPGFGITITFYIPDGSRLANTTIYYGTSEGHETSYLGTTDSQGKITSTNSAFAGKTVYFKSSDERYKGSAYISSAGGTASVSLSEVPEFPWVVVAVLIAVCAIAAVSVWLAWQRGLHKTGAPKRKVKPLEMAKPKEHKPRTKGTPYQSPMAETYFEIFRSAAKEKRAKSLPRVKHREMPTKPFEKR